MTHNDTNSNDAPCPLCRVNHDAAVACTAASQEATPGTPGPLLAQAESLFESYLAARLVRARRNLTSAKVALLRDPRNRDKRDALLHTEAETQKLETQLLEQARRTAKAREHTDDSSRFAGVAPGSLRPTESFRALQAAKAEGAQSTTAGTVEPKNTNVTGEAFMGEDNTANARPSIKLSK